MRCEVQLDVREKTDEGKVRICGAKALDGGEGLVAGVEIDDDELGKRIEELQEGIGIGRNLDFDAEVFCGFGELHLEEEIVHVGNNASHAKETSVGSYEVCTERWDAGRKGVVNRRLTSLGSDQAGAVAEMPGGQRSAVFHDDKECSRWCQRG